MKSSKFLARNFQNAKPGVARPDRVLFTALQVLLSWAHTDLNG